MSNEKPVRITVGDVKEVAEATTIQADTVQPKSMATTSPAYAPQVEGSNGMIMIGGVIGFILFLLAGYYGFAGGQDNHVAAPSVVAPSSSAASAPTANDPATPNITLKDSSPSAANNAPKASNAPAAANNAPVSNNAPAANAPEGNAPAAVNNAPAADNNAPAANNVGK